MFSYLGKMFCGVLLEMEYLYIVVLILLFYSIYKSYLNTSLHVVQYTWHTCTLFKGSFV